MDAHIVTLPKIKVPRARLTPLFKKWIETYEAARKRPEAEDMGHPELVEKNAQLLAEYVGDFMDNVYNAVAGEIIKQSYLHAYAAGLGKPLPTFAIGQETPQPPKPHPQRAVQRVERDPDTLEVVRTVTDYE